VIPAAAEGFCHSNELERTDMLNSMIPRGFFAGRGGRKSLIAATFVLALLSLGLGTAFAQDDKDAPPPPPGQPSGEGQHEGMGRHMGRHGMPTADDQLQHLTKKLNLSEGQQAKLKPILEDRRAQMEKIHSDSSLSREDRFSKMQELRQNSDTQIKNVLNEDQQKNFDKMRQEQRDRMGQWHKGGGNAPPADGGTPDKQQ
jgi:Spy/CpxP family protein refolding chaperone